MSIKWKIFFALNFILALPAFACFLLFIINFSSEIRSSEDYLLFIIFAFGLIMITANGFLNIYIIQRFFPDKLLPISIKRLNITSLVINFIFVAALLILLIYVSKEVFGQANRRKDTSGKIALSIFFLACLIDFIILIMQTQLSTLIARNNREKMNSLINSIGNPV